MPRGLTTVNDAHLPFAAREPAQPAVDALRQALDNHLGLDSRLPLAHAAEPAAVEGSGVSFEEAMARLHVLDRQGELRSGVDAFTVIWDELPGWRWLAKLVRALRLIGPMEWGYGIWLRRRERKRCPVGEQGSP